MSRFWRTVGYWVFGVSVIAAVLYLPILLGHAPILLTVVGGK